MTSTLSLLLGGLMCFMLFEAIAEPDLVRPADECKRYSEILAAVEPGGEVFRDADGCMLPIGNCGKQPNKMNKAGTSASRFFQVQGAAVRTDYEKRTSRQLPAGDKSRRGVRISPGEEAIIATRQACRKTHRDHLHAPSSTEGRAIDDEPNTLSFPNSGKGGKRGLGGRLGWNPKDTKSILRSRYQSRPGCTYSSQSTRTRLWPRNQSWMGSERRLVGWTAFKSIRSWRRAGAPVPVQRISHRSDGSMKTGTGTAYE